ncbi:hypothetical protein G9A89_005494 [Geosiphon pyriformis]|nr:hypothetical protein G9A89_005494 [Geosiphon pyriformis]
MLKHIPNKNWPKQQNPTPFEIFNLRPTASNADVKNRYYELVKQYHPDLSGDKSKICLDRFRKIVAAYEILGNNKKKELYIRHGFGWEKSGGLNKYNPQNDWWVEERYKGGYNSGPLYMENSYMAALVIFLGIFGSVVIYMHILTQSTMLKASADRRHLQTSKDLAKVRRDSHLYAEKRRGELRLMAHQYGGWESDGNVCNSGDILKSSRLVK